jgi:hypothetical protein
MTKKNKRLNGTDVLRDKLTTQVLAEQANERLWAGKGLGEVSKEEIFDNYSQLHETYSELVLANSASNRRHREVNQLLLIQTKELWFTRVVLAAVVLGAVLGLLGSLVTINTFG